MVCGSPSPKLQSQTLFLFLVFMHLSYVLGALYIAKQNIAVLKKALMWKTHHYLIKLIFDSPKEMQKTVTFLV